MKAHKAQATRVPSRRPRRAHGQTQSATRPLQCAPSSCTWGRRGEWLSETAQNTFAIEHTRNTHGHASERPKRSASSLQHDVQAGRHTRSLPRGCVMHGCSGTCTAHGPIEYDCNLRLGLRTVPPAAVHIPPIAAVQYTRLQQLHLQQAHAMLPWDTAACAAPQSSRHTW